MHIQLCTATASTSTALDNIISLNPKKTPNRGESNVVLKELTCMYVHTYIHNFT